MPYQVGSIGVYLLLAVVLEALRGTEERGYLHLWAVGLLVLATQTALDALVGAGLLPPTPMVASALLAVAIGFVTVGGIEFAGVHPSRSVVLAGAAVLAGVTVVHALEVPWIGSDLLRGAVLAFGLTGSGVIVFRRSAPGPGRWLLLAAAIAMGGYLAVLPLVRELPGFDRWEWEVDLLLTVWAAVSILVVHFERARLQERATADRYGSILEHAPAGLFRVEPGTGRVTAANPALRRLLDLGPTDTIAPFGRPYYVHEWQLERLNRLLSVRDRVRGFEALWRVGAGREVVVSIDAWILRDAAERPLAIEGMVRDLTEERRLQARLVRAQRLEALGRLSAGVAHDFNNLLTGAMASAELTLAARHDPEAVRREMEDLREMVRRGGDFTRQLLAFGRQAPGTVGPLDLDAVLKPVLRVLERILGADVVMDVELGEPPPVLASVSQIEQIVTNLVLNARDAMPGGGHLLVRTSHLRTRRSVRLTVRDDGVGMEPSVRARIFEPFFTTKPEGKGTGLGLASVWGTVKQLKGQIRVRSDVGHGTTFEVDLPAANGVGEQRPDEDAQAAG